MDQSGAMLFGRNTYEPMEEAWRGGAPSARSSAQWYAVPSEDDASELTTFPVSVDLDPNTSSWLEAYKPGFSEYEQRIDFDDGQAEKTFVVTLQPDDPSHPDDAVADAWVPSAGEAERELVVVWDPPPARTLKAHPTRLGDFAVDVTASLVNRSKEHTYRIISSGDGPDVGEFFVMGEIKGPDGTWRSVGRTAPKSWCANAYFPTLHYNRRIVSLNPGERLRVTRGLVDLPLRGTVRLTFHYRYDAAAAVGVVNGGAMREVPSFEILSSPVVAVVDGVVAPEKTGMAFLNINSIPASTCFLDGKLLGQTPKVHVEVWPGSHTVTFVDPQHGATKTVSVTADAEETKPAVARLDIPAPPNALP
jgi:hypothetical protein